MSDVNVRDSLKDNRKLEAARALALDTVARLDPDDIWGVNELILILESSLEKARQIKDS